MDNCKICLETLNYDCRNITEYWDRVLSLKHMLIKCVPSLVKVLNDNDYICSNCQVLLETCYRFVVSCEDLLLDSGVKMDTKYGLPNPKDVEILYCNRLDKMRSESIVNIPAEQLEKHTSGEFSDTTLAMDELSSNNCSNTSKCTIKCKASKKSQNCGVKNVKKEKSKKDLSSAKAKKDRHKCVHCLKVFPTFKTLTRHVYNVQYPLFCKICHEVLETSTQLSNHTKFSRCLKDWNKRSCKVIVSRNTKFKGKECKKKRKLKKRKKPLISNTSGNKSLIKLDHKRSLSSKKTQTDISTQKRKIQSPRKCKEKEIKYNLSAPQKNPKLTCRFCEVLIKRLELAKKLVCKSSTSSKQPVWKKETLFVKKVRRAKARQKNFKCNICYKKFGSQEKLEIHSLLHVSYHDKCSWCGSSFPNHFYNKVSKLPK